MTESEQEFWTERSAIREYDGGLPRPDAEAMAVGEVAIAYGWAAAVGLVQEAAP